MIDLQVSIEKNGKQIAVGNIKGTEYADAYFTYSIEYLADAEAVPLSISLPLQETPFTAIKTRKYFDGLLPEGFSRRAVAEWLHEDAEDYISILRGLGRECLGAIQIKDLAEQETDTGYEKLSKKKIRDLAREGATKSTELLIQSHLSLAGASGKVGLYTDNNGKDWFLPKGSAPSTHIVKQSHVRLNDIVINELLCTYTASALGIETVENNIIDTGKGDDSDILLSTKRYDRVINKDTDRIDGHLRSYRLHQEDFAQALGIHSGQKYEKNNAGYAAKMFDLIRRVSANPLEDQIKLWDIIVFNYLIGNTDAHIKNYSLLYGENLQTIRLAPAYDIISTVVYKESTRDMSFSIGGEYSVDMIREEHFKNAVKDYHLGERFAMGRMRKMKELFPEALHRSAQKLADEGYNKSLDIEKKILKNHFALINF